MAAGDLPEDPFVHGPKANKKFGDGAIVYRQLEEMDGWIAAERAVMALSEDDGRWALFVAILDSKDRQFGHDDEKLNAWANR